MLHTGDAVADALNLLPKRAHGTVVVVDDAGRPVGTVDEAACTGVDRFTRLADVLDPAPLTLPLDTPPREVFEALGPRGVALGLDADGRLAGLLTALGAVRAGIYTPARRRRGPAAHRGRGRDQRRRRGEGEGAARRRGGRAGRRHRARPPGEDARRAAPPSASVDAGRDRAGGRRATSSPPEGVRDLAAAGADIVKVGVGPGRDVHHADDDRASGARSSPPCSSAPRPGASTACTSGPTAGCGTPATSRWRWPRARRP